MQVHELALSIAKEAHKGQVDKAGVDYIQHPTYVASLVDTDTEKAVAYLHDVIEDTPITAEDLLGKGLPIEVVTAVQVLTKDKELSYEEYLTKVKENPLARRVKLADLLHNMDLSRLPKITETAKARVKKYQKSLLYLVK